MKGDNENTGRLATGNTAEGRADGRKEGEEYTEESVGVSQLEQGER